MMAGLFRSFAPAPARSVTDDRATVDRRFKRARFQELFVMTTGYAVFYVCRLAFSATKKDIIDEGVYTAATIGCVESALLIAYAFGKCASGFLADRADIRKLMSFGLLVSAAITFAVGFTLPAGMLIGLWFVNGLAQSVGVPCSVVGLSRFFVKKELGTYYGIWSCTNNLGEALSYILTAIVVAHCGWRCGFWAAALVALVGVAYLRLFVKDSPESEGLPPTAVWKGVAADDAAAAAAKDVNRGQKIALRSWAVWMIALAGFFFAMSRYAVINWGIWFLETHKGYEPGLAASVISLNSIVGIGMSCGAGWLSDRFFRSDRNFLTLVFGLMNAGSLILFLFVPGHHVWVDVLAMAMFGSAMGALVCFLGGLMAVDLVPRAAAGAALGIVGIASYGGASVQSVISGFLVTRSFTVASFYWVGSAVLSVLCALTVWRVKRPEEG